MPAPIAAYQISVLDLSKLGNLRQPGLTATIVPIAWLPTKVSRMFQRILRNMETAEVDENEPFAAIAPFYDVLTKVVVDWNLPSPDGGTIPPPWQLEDDKQLERLEEVPPAVLMLIVEHLQDEDVTIPLVSETQSSRQALSRLQVVGSEPPSE